MSPQHRKRVSNACYRCHQQKIRCSGGQPCEQCNRRRLQCSFVDKADKILVSREFIADLERRAERSQAQEQNENNAQGPSTDSGIIHDLSSSPPRASSLQNDDHQANRRRDYSHHASHEPTAGSSSGGNTPSAQIADPFSSHTLRYVADSTGRPWYLGTSSNWAFTRRVLNMAHERLTGQPAQLQSLRFDADHYDLGWNGQRDLFVEDTTLLPSPDHAIYLVEAVNFHCGQLFHLFDEETFMRQFSDFHGPSTNAPKPKDLWYVHYLLILAFGKVFVTRRNETRRPPGADWFVQAMKLLPDITFLHSQPIEAVEILCCKALYLQCLDFRGPAFNVIGQALRIALEQGMHTGMQAQGLDETHVQRCRNVWWTVYILDRQISSVQGVPLAIRDEDISAELPTFSGSVQKTQALELNVKFSRVISQILTTIYGTDGRLTRKFLPSTKNALKSIAAVNNHLKQSFDVPTSSSRVGLSRLSAHLHLLHHQCIILATRPLLFSFLKSRIDRPDCIPAMVAGKSSARTLLQMCIDSSQHILVILDRLKEQDLLETFLTYDLEAAFAASLVLLLVPVVDHSLLEGNFSWVGLAYTILDEMVLQGNRQAAGRRSELQQLQQVFSQLLLRSENSGQDGNRSAEVGLVQASGFGALPPMTNPSQPLDTGQVQYDYSFLEDAMLQNGFTADQLMNVADSLDLDGLDWMTTGSSTFAEPN